jgi:hypothetical protein
MSLTTKEIDRLKYFIFLNNNQSFQIKRTIIKISKVLEWFEENIE